jgi:hypothetical protein
MKRNLIYTIILTIIGIYAPITAQAQVEEGMGDRYIRVAEIGQLADTVNV